MTLVPIYRINTYVVPEYLEYVVDGILNIDDLVYGHYKHVMWFSSEGTEQFKPLEDASPTKGEIGKRTRLSAIKIEFSIPQNEQLLQKVIKEGIYHHHPWDEPVIQVTEGFETRKES